MENGYDRRLAAKFSSSSVTQHNEQQEQPDSSPNEINSGSSDSLFQVMKAVEAAEVTIKHQVGENNRLRAELQRKIQELDSHRLNESLDQRPHPMERRNELKNESFEAHSSVLPAGNQEDGAKSTRYSSVADPTGMLVLNRTLEHTNAARGSVEIHSDSSMINGSLLPGKQMHADTTAPSSFSSPPTMLISANRYHLEGDNDSRFNLSGQVLMPITELNNSNSLVKQDLALKVRDHEDEITQLRNHLAEYSIKEAQIRNEKYVLEKRISYMRLAFDQQQEELVDAASKALSYRQDIIEENIRLTYALQDAHQERSTFVSSLLPLLAEYSLQPPVSDAQSIISNIKVLFKHLQEKLLLTESKLKESQYQLGPWHSDLNSSNCTAQSPSHSLGSTLAASNKNGLEIVPQPSYSLGKLPPSTEGQVTPNWDAFGHHQSGLDAVGAKNFVADGFEKYSPLASRSSASNDMTYQIAFTRNDPTRHEEVSSSKQVTFREPVTNSEMDDLDGDGNHNEREPPINWTSGSSAHTTTVGDPASSYSPNLPPVLEEHSSFSETADDDPLPGIEELQISGEAFPGKALQACGYSINGTTSCNFEWVRHLEDGSVNYIDGAKQPNYLVTADDVDTYLAIEVQPLDNRKRKGELVKVFANDHKKITCDPEMHSQIEKTLFSGHASYKVSLSTGHLDIWEPAVLAIKREGYSIKCSGPRGVVVTEKFSPNTSVFIPFGLPSEFIMINSANDEYLLRVNGSSPDVSCSRDTIVLTLRFFILRAGEKKKKRRGGLFFNK